jgi:hypothetical protein
MLDLKYIKNIKIVNKNEGNFLTDKILLQPKFLKLTKLNAFDNPKITNLVRSTAYATRFKKLTEINISFCGVNDAGICEFTNY